MIAIITGASSGIGREFAHQIDGLGYDEIWLIARRSDRLKGLAEKLKTPVKILSLDLTADDSFKIFEYELKKSRPRIDMLVNSAGLGFNDYFYKNSLEDLDQTVDLNIKAPTRLIKIALPFMGRDSVIINVASVAGFIPQPKFAAYAASKSYLISLSRALNRELRDRKIHVTALCPNPVATEFGELEKKGLKALAIENLEKLVATALKKCRKIDLITSHPLAKFMLIVSKILPHSFIMWIEKRNKMY